MSNNVINIPLGQSEGKKATVVVGSNTFEVSVEPKDLEKLAYVCEEVGEELSNTTDYKEVRKGLKKAFDVVLGKGAFKKIWAESGSLIECSEVFLAISGELAKHQTQAQKAKQFVKNKNRKK